MTGIVVLLAVLIEACSAGRVMPPAVAGTVMAVDPRGRALVRFVHPSGWSIASPGTMTATEDDGAAYVGTDEFLRVTPLVGSTAPGRVASAEAASPLGVGFALARGPHTVRVDGRVASEYEYREDTTTDETAGDLAVMHAIRLYVGYPAGVYRIEYGAIGTAWDPEAGSDILATFRRG
jgi:hypothetical protein